MKLKLLAVLLVLALPLSAQEEPKSEDEVPQEAQPVTLEELAGKVEALTEAATETRNTVDVLNRMRFSGYLQAQYVNDETSLNELSGPAATRNRDQFSVRRARVKFTYQLSSTSRFVLQPDITSSGVTLKDGFVEFTEPWTQWRNTLTAGQFNWPFGFEIMYSSSAREMPERSRVVRTLFPGERDRGVMISGKGFAERFTYQAAIVNGTGTTQAFDYNKRKDLVGRLAWNFGVLDLGASIYRGTELVQTTANARGLEFDKDRQGIDFQWVTPITGLGVRGEYIQGTQPPNAGTTATQSPDVDGWYLYLIQNLGTRHQFVVRADEYDPNTDRDNDATRTLGGSYIFHWDAHSKVMLGYEQPKLEAGNDPDDNVFTLRYQYSF
ncbi:MAG TPA: porin [Thermoanaerobaculia bacterium]